MTRTPGRSASISRSRAWRTSRPTAWPRKSSRCRSCSTCATSWRTCEARSRATRSWKRSFRPRWGTKTSGKNSRRSWIKRSRQEVAMAEPRVEQSQQPAAEVGPLSLLDQIVDKGRFGIEAPARERGRDMIKQFVTEVLAGTITMARDTDTMLNARIAQIDRLISLQVNEVLHHPEFQ